MCVESTGKIGKCCFLAWHVWQDRCNFAFQETSLCSHLPQPLPRVHDAEGPVHGQQAHIKQQPGLGIVHCYLCRAGHQGPCIVVARQKGNHQITVPEDLDEPILRKGKKNHGTNHIARAANFLNVQNLSENSGAVYWLVCLKNASFQIKGWYNLNFGVPNLTQPHICPRIVHFLSLRRKHNPGTPLLESPLISGQLPQSNSHHSSVRSRRLRSL